MAIESRRMKVVYFARVRLALFVIVCLSAFVIIADAEPLSGTVVDASGAPVPGATVVVTAAGKDHSATTNDNGRFDLPEVPDGEVRLRASAPGRPVFEQYGFEAPGPYMQTFLHRAER